MPGRIRLRLCFAALLTMLLMSPVRAEDVPGTLVVKVQDSSGAVIPGAAVRIEHAGEAPRELTADASGQALANPAPGSYSIQVTWEGFSDFSARRKSARTARQQSMRC